MKLLHKINSILDSLIILSHPLTMEELGRRKLFVIFLLALAFLLIFHGAVLIQSGIYMNGIVDFVLVLTFIIFIAIQKYHRNAKYIHRITTIIFFIFFFQFLQSGDYQGYASLWGLTFPVFTFLLFGKREGFLWTLLLAVVILLMFINPYSYFSNFKYSPLFISRYVSIYFLIFVFTYSYENIREKYKLAMEDEQAKLFNEKEKLAEANRLLEDEINKKEQAETELRRHQDYLEDMVAERTIEIQKNNEKLIASERSYRLMADNINDLIWATDMNLKFTFISPSVYRMYGNTVDEAMNLPYEKWNTPESYKKMIDIYRKEIEIEKKGNSAPNKKIRFQLEQIKKDGTLFPVEIGVSFIRDEYGKAIGIVGIATDISERIAVELEREKIKEQLAQSQKMEALGTLVGGLAHDLNNIHMGIIGSFDLLSLTLLEEKLKKKDAIEKFINIGMESSKRSADMINQLLILSKKHEIKLVPLDIEISLKHVYELCKNSFPKSIEMNFRMDEIPKIIMGDMVQIEQVLLNICINASHAMTIMRPQGEKYEGTLTVTAEKVKSDYIVKENHTDAAGLVDYWIRIKISDTGVGMDHDTKRRIFEPFFSTKTESTGLGLSISYNIVKKHGGTINVYSEYGSGSCFSIYFPAYTDGNEVQIDNNDREIEYGSGTVLVIDDEPTILYVAEGFLEQCGYKVITAEGADKGIEVFKKEHSQISAVIIDLSMPKKSGLEVFKELQKIEPDVKVILSSGMLDNETKNNAISMGVKEILSKPYMAAELSKKMKKILKGN